MIKINQEKITKIGTGLRMFSKVKKKVWGFSGNF